MPREFGAAPVGVDTTILALGRRFPVAAGLWCLTGSRPVDLASDFLDTANATGALGRR